LGEIKRNLIKKLDNEKEKDVLIKYFLNGHKDFLNNKDV
jgi:hypothetical protein